MIVEKVKKIVTDRRAVGLVCKPGRAEIERFAARVADFLIQNDLKVQVDPGSCNLIDSKVQPTPIEDMDVDFVVTIGGDGTILHALQHLKKRGTPLFCINRGTVGFLTESSTTTALISLERVLDGDCMLERCTNLASGVGKTRFADALNEVYVASCVPGRLLTFRVSIDGKQIDYGRADGCMLATPCGSTAYSIAAGGSIVTPGVNGFIFVPVCPPRFELKSMVIPDTSVLELELVKPGACCLAVIDGQVRYDVQPKDTVWIMKAESTSCFIRLYDNYYDRLNTRLVPRTL